MGKWKALNDVALDERGEIILKEQDAYLDDRKKRIARIIREHNAHEGLVKIAKMCRRITKERYERTKRHCSCIDVLC